MKIQCELSCKVNSLFYLLLMFMYIPSTFIHILQHKHKIYTKTNTINIYICKYKLLNFTLSIDQSIGAVI